MALGAVASLAFFFFCAAFQPVSGHAFLSVPKSRNLVANEHQTEYCPHCLQAGGPGKVEERGNGVWPTKNAPQSHGLCGDPVQNLNVEADWRNETYLVPSPIQATYAAGSVVEFRIGVSTHHKGHYEFRICDKALSGTSISSRQEGQDCLDTWLLRRAPLKAECPGDKTDADCQPIDEDHPERWYLPPIRRQATQRAGEDWEDSMAAGHESVSEEHRMRYFIPEGLSCTHCTLQWYWSTGNTCLYDGGYLTFFQRMSSAGWPATAWCAFCGNGASCQASCCGHANGNGKFAEEFWNCADVAVVPGGPGATPSPTLAPSPGQTPTPTATPTPMPTPPPPMGTCSKLYQQCGGQNHAGPFCCESGSWCYRQNEWYSQCKPNSEATPAPPPPTPAPPAPTPTPPAPTPTPPAPMPAPPAPTPTPPAPASDCQQWCARTEVASCATLGEGSCEQSFIYTDGAVMPCGWESCGCFADGEGLAECPLLDCGSTGEPEPESEQEPEAEAEPEPEPEQEPSPATPPPPPATPAPSPAAECQQFCVRTEAAECASLAEVPCNESFMSHDGAVVPCSWRSSCGCQADVDALAQCPQLDCSLLFLQEVSEHDGGSERAPRIIANVVQQQLQPQQRRPRSSRGFLAPMDDAVLGSAFVAQRRQMCSKLESLVEEEEEEEEVSEAGEEEGTTVGRVERGLEL